MEKTVKVYRFKGWSQEHGAMIRPNVDVYLTLDSIQQLKLQPLMDESLEIDASLLFEGAYHPPGR